MKGITGGVFGPTGPCPLLPTGPTGLSGFRHPSPIHNYNGVHLRVLGLSGVSGVAYVAGSSGGCSTGAGFAINASDSPTFFPFDNPRQVHVFVPPGSQVRWLIS